MKKELLIGIGFCCVLVLLVILSVSLYRTTSDNEEFSNNLGSIIYNSCFKGCLMGASNEEHHSDKDFGKKYVTFLNKGARETETIFEGTTGEFEIWYLSLIEAQTINKWKWEIMNEPSDGQWYSEEYNVDGTEIKPSNETNHLEECSTGANICYGYAIVHQYKEGDVGYEAYKNETN